jgi:tRNA A-37 threonylcarbamoyl transferase component Bud32
MAEFVFTPSNRSNIPDFSDLPWQYPFSEWSQHTSRLEEIQHGISRHPVLFINYDGSLYVIKEFPERIAQKEYELLSLINEHNLPCVKPVGYADLHRDPFNFSYLITRYLESSIPYRSLIIGDSIDQFQTYLLDAISGLLVQLHSNGFFWGDCSLSNILFKRDAGALQAYLVDAETAEYHSPLLPPMLRFHELEIMQNNLAHDLTQLQADELLSLNYPARETGPYIQQRYRELWEEITREISFKQDELYQIQERIRAINSLGFSVKDIEIKPQDHTNVLKLRVFVSDRSYHRNQLLEMTGLNAEEKQALIIINEINQLKAKFNQSGNQNISMEAVAYHWLEHVYRPVIDQLKPILNDTTNPKSNVGLIEMYCQILEHKWYLSERAQHDVGHQAAVEDYIKQFGQMHVK